MKAMQRFSLYAALLSSLLPLQTLKSQAAEPQGPYTFCVNNPDDPICTGSAQAGPVTGVTDAMLAPTRANRGCTPTATAAAHRYSTLTQINAGNAKDLKVAWIIVARRQDRRAGDTELFHDGLVYFPQDNKVFAIDGGTGNVVWKYEHKLPDDWGGYNVPFFTGKHRGVAMYGENVYFLSNDAKLHAIDYEDRQGQVGRRPTTASPIPKDFAKSKDSNGYCTTVGPMAIPGHHHRADERDRHRRPARLRAGRGSRRPAT